MSTEQMNASSGTTPCLLTYRFSTEPAPIQVSTPQTAASARINLGVFGSSTPVYCNEIQIAVPIGSDATDLSENTPADSVNTPKWTVESIKIVDGSEIGMNAGTNYARYTFQTRDPSDNEINYNLVFSLVADVNQSTGQFNYLIQETSGTTNDPGTFTPKDCTFTLSKTTPQFYLKNFVATAPGSPTVPATEFANGADIRFSWESNGTFFQIFEKNKTTPVYAGTATEFPLSGGVQTDSTFILVGSVTGDPSGGNGGGGYEPVYLYEALTVTVTNPDLTPQSVTVAGNASVGGTFGVHGASTLGSTTATDLAVSGNLGVSGAATVNNVTASGSLGVDGTSSLKNTTIDGTLTVTQGASFDGAVKVDGVISGVNNIGGGAASIQGYGTGGNAGVFAFKYDRANFGDTPEAVQIWNSSSGVYKTFIVHHPLDEDKYMVHATLEGPEGAVYYRGTSQLSKGKAIVSLPRYFEAFTRKADRTIILTNVDGFDRIAVQTVNGEKITEGRFVVVSDDPTSSQQFDWEVKAVRADGPELCPEPFKSDLQVGGFGPYTFEVRTMDAVPKPSKV